MKEKIKRLLDSVGLLNFFRKIKARFNPGKYQHTKEWHLRIGDLHLTFDTSDPHSNRWFYPRYADGRIHEPVTTKLFLDYIKKDSQVLDIGGHLGYFSCIAGKLASQGCVHVFEVDSNCLELIKKNLAINNITNVTIHHLAVTDKNDFVKIPKLTHPDPGLIINSSTGNDYIEVKGIRLDDFVSQHNIKPDFIKIDVEGAEWNVLNGMKNILNQENLILLAEIHVDQLRKYFNTDYSACIDILLNNGFTVENIDHRLNESSFQPVDKNTKLEGNTMLLCKKTRQPGSL